MQNYRISEVIGDGTYGVVYRGINLEKNEQVAIKKLKSKISSWKKCTELSEIKSLLKLKNHQNIIKLKEVIREPSSDVYFIFEYADCNLFDLIEKNRKVNSHLTEPKIKDIVYQIASGLNYMHTNGFFHRDLKPENILMISNTIKIADLGSCREIEGKEGSFTDYVCTRWYRPPECVLKSRNYDNSMDIWALGCIMAELFNFKPLFPGKNEFDQLNKITSLLGTPKPNEWNEGIKLCQKVGVKFPQNKGVSFEEILPEASREAISFISELLQWDPNRRLKAKDILTHPYFQEPKKSSNQVFKNISNHNLNNNNKDLYQNNIKRPSNIYISSSNEPTTVRSHNNVSNLDNYMNSYMNNYSYNQDNNNYLRQNVSQAQNDNVPFSYLSGKNTSNQSTRQSSIQNANSINSKFSFYAQNDLNLNLSNKYSNNKKIDKENSLNFNNLISGQRFNFNNIDMKEGYKQGQNFPLPFNYFKY